MEEVLSLLLRAHREKVKVTIPIKITLEEAYRIQEELVRSLGGKIIGYKLGLTREDLLRKFGLSSPLYGVLLDFMDKTGRTVDLENAVDPSLELEIVAKKEKEWRYYLGFELPDSKITNSDPYSLIANDVNAWRIVVNSEEINPSEIKECILYKDGRELGRGIPHLKYLSWLEEKVKIDDGMIVFTGAIVGPVKLERGKYEGLCDKYRITLNI